MFDLLVRGGRVIDGTKAPAFRADVGIEGDRITAVGDLSTAASKSTIDATGQVVAPGFIDLHTHSDGWLLREANFAPKTTQGFTTEILMADGISYAPVQPHNAAEWMYYLRSLNGLRLDEYTGWRSLADYLTVLDRKTAQNFAVHVPYANVRVNALGWGRGAPDDYQAREIRAAIRQGMDEGAVGLSTGLDYIGQCFSATDELVAACEAMADRKGLYVTHVRYKRGLINALNEAIEIALRAEVPLHISHLKASGGVPAEEVIELLDRASSMVDLSFDVYPYQPGSTMLNFLIPNECWEAGPIAAIARLREPAIRERFAAGLAAYELDLDHIHIAWTLSRDNAIHQGKSLSEYVAEMKKPAADALCDLLIEERLSVLLVFNQGDDRMVHPFLKHSAYLMGSDGIYFPDGQVHPRVTGSATRLLGPCVRDWKLFSLEEAVWKLSAGPAARFGLANRGKIAAGSFADLVVFDPDTVSDQATYLEPHQSSIGIDTVINNGTPIVQAGRPIPFSCGDAPGRALRRGQ